MLDDGVEGRVRQHALGAAVQCSLARVALDPLEVRAGFGEDPRDRLGHLRTDAVAWNEHHRVRHMRHGARTITQFEYYLDLEQQSAWTSDA